METTTKEFECKWGDWDSKAMNGYDDKTSVEGEEFFSDEKGYTEADIRAIKDLKPGQSFTCEYGNHTVKRLS